MLYHTLIPSVLLYGADAWTLLSINVIALEVTIRKALRKMFGPMRVGDDLRIRTNNELYTLLNPIDVFHCSNTQRICWHGHLIRIDDNVLARPIFDAGISENDL